MASTKKEEIIKVEILWGTKAIQVKKRVYFEDDETGEVIEAGIDRGPGAIYPGESDKASKLGVSDVSSKIWTEDVINKWSELKAKERGGENGEHSNGKR